MRRFEKKYNSMMQEYCYKDLDTREVYTREEYFDIVLNEEVELVNRDDTRDSKKKPNEGRRYLS